MACAMGMWNMLSGLCSGEVLPRGLMRSWTSKVQHFFNKYGPTEAAVDVLARKCTASMRFPSSIGWPFPNIRVYIVDLASPLALVPPGIPGELAIAGVQVGRGYLGLPDLTSQRFVRNPFCDDCRFERLYLTGDLCRWLVDGSVSFISRLDSQIKLRGCVCAVSIFVPIHPSMHV